MDHNRRVVALPLDDVLPNRFQPRIKFNEESIIELSESIKEHGVIQPIVVRPVGDKYEIIAGERRYKASCMAGLTTIPALITDLNDKDSAEVALIENVQRKDLTPIEEAISYKKILDMGYLTQEKLADKLGKSQSAVANKLRLLNLDEEVQEALLEDKISERHARSLLKLTDAESQRKILTKIINERLTVRKTDEEISKMLNGNYVDNQEEIVVKSEVQEPIAVESQVLEPQVVSPVNPESMDAIEKDIDFEPNNFEIPKFEDLFVTTDTAVDESNLEKPKVENTVVENNDYGIPKFEDIFKEIDNPEAEASVSDEVEIPSFDEPSVPENVSVEQLVETPVPFSFDSLFIEDADTVEEPSVIEENMHSESSEVIDIPEKIEEVAEIESVNEAKPFDFSSIFATEPEPAVQPKEEVGSNTYVVNDMKPIINTVKNCAETIEKYGFKVEIEEFDLEDEYKVTFTIKK